MVAYSFRQQFVVPILSGEKRHTIRGPRRRHAQPGEALQLYAGMRTRGCRLIGTARCEAVQPIHIDFAKGTLRYGPWNLGLDELNRFARSDGFTSWTKMRSSWRKQHGAATKFDGLMVVWANLVPGAAAQQEMPGLCAQVAADIERLTAHLLDCEAARLNAGRND